MGSITEDLAATASVVPQPRPSGRKLSIAPLPTANPESRVRQVPPVERRRRSSLALNLAQRPAVQGSSANPPRIPTIINLADRVRSHSDDALRNRPFTADPACGGERPFMFPSRRRVGISFSSENNASNLTRPRNKSSSELESVSHVWKNGVFNQQWKVKKLQAFWELTFFIQIYQWRQLHKKTDRKHMHCAKLLRGFAATCRKSLADKLTKCIIQKFYSSSGKKFDLA